MATSNLTPAAVEGYESPALAKCPYYTSSPNGLAWFVGRWLRQNSRSAPNGVRPGRGYIIRANDLLFRVNDSDGSVFQVQ